MKIIFYNIGNQGERFFSSAEVFKSPSLTCIYRNTVLSETLALEPGDAEAEILAVFVDSQLTENTLRKFPGLKLIATLSTGFDHIALDYCKKNNIAICTVPVYGEHTVAEYTFALMLALVRKLPGSALQKFDVSNLGAEQIRGYDLKNKTLGVIGTGKIGKNVIRIAKAFEMSIVAYDVYKDEVFAQNMNFKYLPLEELLAVSEIITLHVPNLKETYHMLNESNLPLIKQDAFLINTSRGAVIHSEPLFKLLKSGHLRGAALDVLEEEAACFRNDSAVLDTCTESTRRIILANEMLIDLPNVIITPHNAFNTHEALDRIYDTTAKNIVNFQNNTPSNLVAM